MRGGGKCLTYSMKPSRDEVAGLLEHRQLAGKAWGYTLHLSALPVGVLAKHLGLTPQGSSAPNMTVARGGPPKGTIGPFPALYQAEIA